MAQRYQEGNWLRAALSRRNYRQLAANGERVILNNGQVLLDAGGSIRWVHFLDSSLVFILAPLENDKVAEVTIVGREGMVGLPIFLGADAHPYQGIVQAPAAALRLPAEALQSAIRRNSALHERLLGYANTSLVQVCMTMFEDEVAHRLVEPLPLSRWLRGLPSRFAWARLVFVNEFFAVALMALPALAVNRLVGIDCPLWPKRAHQPSPDG